MSSAQSQLKTINLIVKRFIVLAAPNKKEAENLLAWWDDKPAPTSVASVCDDLGIRNLEDAS